MQAKNLKITPDGVMYAKISGGSGPQQAFDRLLNQLRDRRISEQVIADVAMRYFKILLRPADITFGKMVWSYIQTKSGKDPIGCVFHHDGWIFFGWLR